LFFKRPYSQGNRRIGFTGTGGANGKQDIVFADAINHAVLVGVRAVPLYRLAQKPITSPLANLSVAASVRLVSMLAFAQNALHINCIKAFVFLYMLHQCSNFSWNMLLVRLIAQNFYIAAARNYFKLRILLLNDLEMIVIRPPQNGGVYLLD
jgi:hypothetical protein